METLKLLVIDDEPGIRSGVLRILKNYQVSYTSSLKPRVWEELLTTDIPFPMSWVKCSMSVTLSKMTQFMKTLLNWMKAAMN